MAGVAKVEKVPSDAKSSEMLPVVDSVGVVNTQASRPACHNGSKLMHPVVHMHILGRNGSVYLQRRSADKDLYPLLWDTAVGGHVCYGEYMEEALYREAAEELGFFDFNPQFLTSYVFETETEKELVNVYAAVGDFELCPDNFEVCDGRWWSIEEIERKTGSGILTPNFETEFKLIKDNLLALL